MQKREKRKKDARERKEKDRLVKEENLRHRRQEQKDKGEKI